MFVVEPERKVDLKTALGLIGSYPGVEYKVTLEEGTITVTVGADGEDERMCEAAFQMTFHQKAAYACPTCAAEGEVICGHLCFTREINFAF